MRTTSSKHSRFDSHVKTPLIFVISLAFVQGTLASAQGVDWQKHKFRPYHLEFETPSDWTVVITNRLGDDIIECFSRDKRIYCFIATADNSRQTQSEAVLALLKIAYEQSKFEKESREKINNVDFLFTEGTNYLDSIKTYIKLGVGKYKNTMIMVDAGFSEWENRGHMSLLNQIIASIRGIKD